MSVTADPTLDCTSCKTAIPLDGKRVGDSTHCPKCGQFEVITRTKVTGELATARQRSSLSAAERAQLDETLRRIKLRRRGRASRHVDLFPSWAIFLAAGQFWLSALLAGRNLEAMGDRARGRRLQWTGAALYVGFVVAFLGIWFQFGASIHPAVGLTALVAVAAGFTLSCYLTQHAACSAAREAGAGRAPVLLPLLVGLMLAIAQGFGVWFLRHTLARGF